MFERRERVRRWLDDVVGKFRQKGAVSPDKAMTVEELGLPPRFEEAMKRRLGRSGIFIEVNGKYYLSEERLKQIEELRSERGETGDPRKRIMTLRLFQLGTVIFFVILLLVSIVVQNSELRQYLLVASVIFMAAWIVITILQIHYLSRARKRFAPQQISNTRTNTS